MGGSYRRINIVVNALPAGDLGEALALLLFALDAGLPSVLNREHPPLTRQRSLQGGRVVQVAGRSRPRAISRAAGESGLRVIARTW